MLGYYLRLAWLSLKRQPGLSSLMVVILAVGLASAMTMLTLYSLAGRNPIPWKQDSLFAVQLDTLGEGGSWDNDPALRPTLVSLPDAKALLRSPVPMHQAAMFSAMMTILPNRPNETPTRTSVRVTTRDFFTLFDVGFRYGGTWDARADQGMEPIVVLSSKMNEQLFGGENSVGKKLRMDNTEYTVIGVLEAWRPVPRYYDTRAGGPFSDPEDIYIPFGIVESHLDKIEVRGRVSSFQSFDTYVEMMHSPNTVWVQYWAELKNPTDRIAYVDWLSAYDKEQRKLGRFGHGLGPHIANVDEWLSLHHVVSDDQRTLVILAFLFFAICLLNTMGLMLAKFMRKSAELALRRAMGASRRQLMLQNLTEGLLIGSLAAALGLVLTGLGLVETRRLFTQYSALAHVDPTMVTAGVTLALVGSLIIALYPAWRTCQVAIAAQLKTQ